MRGKHVTDRDHIMLVRTMVWSYLQGYIIVHVSAIPMTTFNNAYNYSRRQRDHGDQNAVPVHDIIVQSCVMPECGMFPK